MEKGSINKYLWRIKRKCLFKKFIIMKNLIDNWKKKLKIRRLLGKEKKMGRMKDVLKVEIKFFFRNKEERIRGEKYLKK